MHNIIFHSQTGINYDNPILENKIIAILTEGKHVLRVFAVSNGGGYLIANITQPTNRFFTPDRWERLPKLLQYFNTNGRRFFVFDFENEFREWLKETL